MQSHLADAPVVTHPGEVQKADDEETDAPLDTEDDARFYCVNNTLLHTSLL